MSAHVRQMPNLMEMTYKKLLYKMYMLLLAMHCMLLTMILLIFCRELVRVQ